MKVKHFIKRGLQKKFFFFFFYLIVALFANAQTILDSKVLEKVQSSVFEVIVEKPEEKGIEYEKALPFSRISFAIRNDKYIPQGTAFLTKDGKFYSAAHVFLLTTKTVFENYYIRDKNGNVYKIDEITELSTNRDFISFTVKDYKKEEGAGLEFTDEISLNSQIFSVGNALGEGIVIRNGVLTSQTYENENGEWKWLRFSAAASPGNSGGPLITDEGKVLGIITMKSQNENLNYALPALEIENVEKNEGYVYSSFYYKIPNILSDRFYHKFIKTIPLPEKLSKVQEIATNSLNEYCADILSGIREEFSPISKKGFTKTTGWEEKLTNNFYISFPYTVYLTENNVWSYSQPAQLSSHQLEDNGTVVFGGMLGFAMGLITKPDSIGIKELIENPKQYCEYILKANHITRNVAGENISITSLGEPSITSQYVDFFDRTWLINYWDLDFADSMLVTFVLPLPEGLYYIYSLKQTGQVLNASYLDIAFMCDFVTTSYSGTFKEWEEYLELPESLVGKKPQNFKNFSFKWDKDKSLVATDKMGFELNSQIFPASENTTLRVNCGYSFEDNKLVIDNRSIYVFTNRRSENYRYVHLSNFPKPAKSALKTTIEQWEQKLNRVSPFSGQPYNYEDNTYLDHTLYPSGVNFETRSETDHFYVLSLELDGQGKFEEMESFAKEVEDSIILK